MALQSKLICLAISMNLLSKLNEFPLLWVFFRSAMDVFLMDYGYCSAVQRIGDMIANQIVLLFYVLYEVVMSNM